MKELKKEELVRLTQDLIRIPSVRREGEKEEKVALFLAHFLEEMGLDVVVEEVEPGSPNVIAVLHGQGEGPCLMFEGHMDVVTEGDAFRMEVRTLRGKTCRRPDLWQRGLRYEGEFGRCGEGGPGHQPIRSSL